MKISLFTQNYAAVHQNSCLCCQNTKYDVVYNLSSYSTEHRTRKAHKNRVFIINPLTAKLIFQVHGHFQGQVQGLIQGQGQILGKV